MLLKVNLLCSICEFDVHRLYFVFFVAATASFLLFNSLASPPKFSWKFVILFRSGSAVSVLALTLTSCRLLMLTDYGCLFLYLVFFLLHTCIQFCYFRWSKSIRPQPCYSPWRKILFQRQRDVEDFF